MIYRITAQTSFEKRHHMVFGRALDDIGEPLPVQDPEKVKKENAIKDVCLNCTKEKCKGSEKCFMKERDTRK